MKRRVQWQQWTQQGKSCSPSDAKPSTHISTEHQGCHLHPPGDGPRTKDNHGSHYGQHFVRLRTRTTSWSTVSCKQGRKTRCKCAPANFPCTALCYFQLWRRPQCRLAWWQHSNLPANFVWVVATSFLFKLWIYCPIGTLDCDFWIDSLQIFRVFHTSIETHISPFHTSTTRP